ncbi:Capsule biosynthesis protein (plasmid) [Corynebacterium glyciniphilum AJ 3170]|uniref:Capsule biosynthesis protein n=1 Tax=Corynebacterium glyciniphilum AJ 3170 TaxID=1404245 RepID=X5EE38_9CORY|nr:poly-gamma-glutamate synthase PgsB [Corynebacterium glyciniphilum]AHW65660.1 Capsule biosynthesis protein [Corynebacterium glyciniphilum AJ 3170]
MLSFLSLSAVVAATGMATFHGKEVRHSRRIDSLEINVHVNGIRGKSTVTRMIGGVLREAGKTTIAKTTGTFACVIDSDGGEHPIRRTGPANINEQYRFLAEWLDGTEALVVECMAVKPKYQALCQDVILRSPVTVLTNVRLDHQEDMGDTLEEIAASLCTTVPQNGLVITGERDPKLVRIIRRHCEARNSRLVVAQESELSRSLCTEFDYRQFEENVAVVLAVAEALGINAETAARGMLAAAPDPGTTRIAHVRDVQDGPFYWVPMFAVNDWESTTRVFHDVVDADLPSCRKVVALNNRADRTDRAAMFVDLVAQDLASDIDRVVLYGEIQDAVRQKLLNAGVDDGMIVTTSDLDGEQGVDGRDLVKRARAGFEGQDVAIFGMVNIHTDHVTAMERYIGALAPERSDATAA